MSRSVLEAYQRADGVWVTRFERPERTLFDAELHALRMQIHTSLWFGARCATIDPKMLRVTGI